MTTPDDDITAAVDGDGYVEQKLDALRAHRTQVTVDGPFFALSNNVGNRAWGTEFFRIAKGRPAASGTRRARDGPVRGSVKRGRPIGACPHAQGWFGPSIPPWRARSGETTDQARRARAVGSSCCSCSGSPCSPAAATSRRTSRPATRSRSGPASAASTSAAIRPVAATDVLRDELGGRASTPFTVVVNGRTMQVRPSEVGLDVDYSASVHAAGAARSWSPARLWAYYTGGARIDPVTPLDQARLASLIDRLDAVRRDAADRRGCDLPPRRLRGQPSRVDGLRSTSKRCRRCLLRRLPQ